MSYSGQKYALTIIPKVTGSLSIVGSFLMARDVYKKWRGQRSNEQLPITMRIIACMCIADMGSSFWGHFMGTWMMPAEFAKTWPFVAGNSATCSAQAFLHHCFVMVGGWYNATLALTHYLIVCRQMSERELKNWKYQLLLLGWPSIYGLSMALVNLIASGDDSPFYDLLWYCQAWAGSWMQDITAATVYLNLVIILFSMGSLVRFVYLVEKRMDRFTQGDDSGNRAKTLEMCKQAISYVVVYLVTWVPSLVIMANPPDSFYIVVACTFPLQGFLNSIVFFRPKYITARKRRGAEGDWRFGTLIGVLDIPVPAAVTQLANSLGSIMMRSSPTGQGHPVPEAGKAEDTEDVRENK